MIDPEKGVPLNGVGSAIDGELPPPDAASMGPPPLLGALPSAGQPQPSRNAIPKRSPPPYYNCMKCPGYCCSYPIITVTRRDLERLAKHFGLAPEVAEKRFTKSGHGYKRIMRRKSDEHFGKICRFFDRVQRRCTVYAARPAVCRAFPGDGRCGYYDFLSFERRAQGDPEYVAQTYHAS